MSDALVYHLVLDAERVGRWLTARDDRITAPPSPGTDVPLPFLVFLRMQPILGMSIHKWLDRDPERGLYGGVSYSAVRLPRVGETLTVTSAVNERKQVRSALGELMVTTLCTRYLGTEGAVATETVRMIDLPSADRPPTGQSQAPRQAVSPEEPVLAEWPGISRRQAAWMTVETGDHNPLHVDSDVAVRRGFADVVVPAPLLTALIERELAGLLGAHPLRLEVRYQAPTLPGFALSLHGRRDHAGELSFNVFGDGLIRANGRAALVAEEV